MDNLDFSSFYKKLCSKHNIDKQDFIQDALSLDGTLNISNHPITEGTCAIIGKILEVSNHITKINAESCMLEEDALKPILLGLSTNRTLTSLNLKGNSLTKSSVLNFAHLLSSNHYITSLILEWNNLGLCSVSFSSFCEALQSNRGLKHLDLKSNQLDISAAPFLSKVLSNNSVLTDIDLGFNNFGNEGGKILLEGLQSNFTLLKLDLVCNNVYDEVLNEIDCQLNRIRGLVLEKDKHRSESDQLRQSLINSEERSSQYIQSLEKEVLQKKSSLATIIRDSQNSIHSLQDKLTFKSEIFEALDAKHQVTTSALDKERELSCDLQAKCSQLELQLKEAKDCAVRSIKEAKEREMELIQVHQQEKDVLQSIISKQELQISDLESKWRVYKNDGFVLKEKLISIEAELKATKYENEESLANEKSDHKEALRKLERSHSVQIKKINGRMEEMTKENKKKMIQLERQVEELEVELRQRQLEADRDKENHTSQVNAIKTQMKVEQTSLKRSCEEQTRTLEEQVESLRLMKSDLVASTNKKETKIHALSSQIAVLKSDLEEKEAAVVGIESRLRSEFSSQSQELLLLKEEKIKQHNKVLQLQSQHENERRDLEFSKRKLREEASDLQAAVVQKEAEILKMRQDESRRVGALQTAFMQYFQPPS